MSQISRRILVYALAQCPGIGGKSITKILTRNDIYGRTPDEFLNLGPEVLTEEYKLRAAVASRWHNQKQNWLDEAKALSDLFETHKIKIVTAADAHYPTRIETLDPDPPGLLYLYGNHKLLDMNTFTVLASRNTTARQKTEMEKLAEEHVLQAQTTVTSHDTPEYQRVAVTALRWGAPRILVLDTGLFDALGNDLKEEPFAAARLWRFQFDPQVDLAISAVNPLKTFHKNSNKVRDRLVASLSLNLDFVHITPNGQMHKLALAALKAGRQVRISETCLVHDALEKIGAKSIPEFPMD